MRNLRARRNLANAVLAALLVFGLLYSQWLGLGHRIAHADLAKANPQMVVAALQSQFDLSGSASHSCLVYDAVTLGATLHMAFQAGARLPNAHGARAALILSSWHPPFTGHYSSRAPPSA